MGNLVIAIIGIVFSIALLAAGIGYISPTAYVAHNQAVNNTAQVDSLVADYNNLTMVLGHRPTNDDYIRMYPASSANSTYAYDAAHSNALTVPSSIVPGASWKYIPGCGGGNNDCFCLTVPANAANPATVFKAAQISANSQMNSGTTSRIELSTSQCDDTATPSAPPASWAVNTANPYYLTVRLTNKVAPVAAVTYATSVSYFGCSNRCGAGYKQPDLSTFTCTDSNNTPAPGKCPTPGAQSCYDTSGCGTGTFDTYTGNPTWSPCSQNCTATNSATLLSFTCTRDRDQQPMAPSYCGTPTPPTCPSFVNCGYNAVLVPTACLPACGQSSETLSWYCQRSDGTPLTSASNECQSHGVAAPTPASCSDYSTCQPTYSAVPDHKTCSATCGAGTEVIQDYLCTGTLQTGANSSTTVYNQDVAPGAACGKTTAPSTTATSTACLQPACAKCGTAPDTCDPASSSTPGPYDSTTGQWTCSNQVSNASCGSPPVDGVCSTTTAGQCTTPLQAVNYDPANGTWQCPGQYGGNPTPCAVPVYRADAGSYLCVADNGGTCGPGKKTLVSYNCIEYLNGTQIGSTPITPPATSNCSPPSPTNGICDLGSCTTYAWVPAYGSCTPACGASSRPFDHYDCYPSVNGVQQNSASLIVCQRHIGPQPTNGQPQSCTDYSQCTYVPVATYGACNAACGSQGTEPVTSITCKQEDSSQNVISSTTATVSNGVQSPQTSCATPPDQSCTGAACSVTYKSSCATSYTACSTSCGIGTQSAISWPCAGSDGSTYTCTPDPDGTDYTCTGSAASFTNVSAPGRCAPIGLVTQTCTSSSNCQFPSPSGGASYGYQCSHAPYTCTDTQNQLAPSLDWCQQWTQCRIVSQPPYYVTNYQYQPINLQFGPCSTTCGEGTKTAVSWQCIQEGFGSVPQPGTTLVLQSYCSTWGGLTTVPQKIEACSDYSGCTSAQAQCHP